MDAKSLHVENVPAELIKRAKITAATEGLTLREWIIRALSSAANGKPKGAPRK